MRYRVGESKEKMINVCVKGAGNEITFDSENRRRKSRGNRRERERVRNRKLGERFAKARGGISQKYA